MYRVAVPVVPLLAVAVKVILVTPPPVPTVPLQCQASIASLNAPSSGVHGMVPVAEFGDWSAHVAVTPVMVEPLGAVAEPKQLTAAPGRAVPPEPLSQLGLMLAPAAFCTVAAW